MPGIFLTPLAVKECVFIGAGGSPASSVLFTAPGGKEVGGEGGKAFSIGALGSSDSTFSRLRGFEHCTQVTVVKKSVGCPLSCILQGYYNWKILEKPFNLSCLFSSDAHLVRGGWKKMDTAKHLTRSRSKMGNKKCSVTHTF